MFMLYKSTLPIKFIDSAHMQFFEQMLSEFSRLDIYRVVFFYLMGLLNDTRLHIRELYNFEWNCIFPPQNSRNAAWQTSGTRKVCNLAYNLYNGYVDEVAMASKPYDIFDSPLSPFFVCAIQMLYESAFLVRHRGMIIEEDGVWNLGK